MTLTLTKGSDYIKDIISMVENIRRGMYSSENLVSQGYHLASYTAMRELDDNLHEDLARQIRAELVDKTIFAKGSEVQHKDGRCGMIDSEATPSGNYLCVNVNGCALMWKPEDISNAS